MANIDFDLLKRIAAGLARQFGPNCEVAIHDLSKIGTEDTIVAIENGHVTGRKAGDGPSRAVLEALHEGGANREDQLDYLTKTHDGRMLKSSTIYVNDENGRPAALLSINYDITPFIMAQSALKALTAVNRDGPDDAEYIPMNVNDLLDELIDESVRFIGKPVAMMNKEDKTSAIQFLEKKGAFLIKKSGDKISKFYGISKYTLYNYLDLET